jgi:RNA polymerase sigma factor (TIGR02999 family)
MSDVTQLMEAAGRGEAGASERLLDRVYAELRRMAEQRLHGDAAGLTLQPTVLVHDVWLQLCGPEAGGAFANRAHFFSAAAGAMRRMLIDRARRKHAAKRGGRMEHVDLDSVEIAATANDDVLLKIDEALERLAREDPAVAELVRLRFFAGLKIEEAAETLGISERTAKRYWTFARAWLYDALQEDAAA